jgi:two-component system NtrC family sensor kinase
LNVAITVFFLLLSTTLTVIFSTRVLESQVHAYAELLARQVTLSAQILWHTGGRDALGKDLQALIQRDDNSALIDIFFFHRTDDEAISSRPGSTVVSLTPAERQAAQEGREHSSLTSLEGQPWMHIVAPLRDDGQVIGAVRVQARVLGAQRLKTDEVSLAVFFATVFAIGLLFMLKVFFDRQINRPLGQLVTAMNAAEAGNLTTRVDLHRADEIGQLGAHFDRMLARLEHSDAENRSLMERLQRFNDELEARVQQVTQELVERNHELLRLQREMARVEPLAALGRMTGSIAHELGTPLNSVLGYSQLLTQEALPDSARESVQIIETQVHRMAEIIQHYLSRTRDAARRYQQLHLNTLVQDTLMLLKPTFQQHHLQVTTVLDAALPSLNGDTASLQRVLLNLLNNAVDAMENGGVLTVTTRVSTPPNTAQAGVIVEVADTGPGIPPEVLPHVFDLFMTTKSPGKGTGLGLAICQEIVKSHGGTLALTSEAGRGTRAQIFLPTAAQNNLEDHR